VVIAQQEGLLHFTRLLVDHLMGFPEDDQRSLLAFLDTAAVLTDLLVGVDLYKVTLTYDRDSNITSAADAVHAGFDALYGMDNLNRLINADEGTLSGGTISTRKRQELWTLTQTGN